MSGSPTKQSSCCGMHLLLLSCRIDYRTFLERFNRFEEFSDKVKSSQVYKQYLGDLARYLLSFLQRSQPLVVRVLVPFSNNLPWCSVTCRSACGRIFLSLSSPRRQRLALASLPVASPMLSCQQYPPPLRWRQWTQRSSRRHLPREA